MNEKNNKAQYDMDYAKKKLKRIPLDVTKEKYQEIKSAAQSVNESVNGYIKKAIDNRMNIDVPDTTSSNKNLDSNKIITQDNLVDDNGDPLIMPWEE